MDESVITNMCLSLLMMHILLANLTADNRTTPY